MHAYIGVLLWCSIGVAMGDYPQRAARYNIGANQPYVDTFNPNLFQEPSQRLFWGNQGSNQVGGTGLWATLTNKFPFLDKMFGRLELPAQNYNTPNRYEPIIQYNTPEQVRSQYNQIPQNYQSAQLYQIPQQYQAQQTYQTPQLYQAPKLYQAPQFYQAPQSYQTPQFYQTPNLYQAPQIYQAPQSYQTPQLYQQFPQQPRQIAPIARDVGITDDAVIVTPPFVPPVQQPTPVVPAPAPAPAPVPTGDDNGYRYDKPQIRLELPHK